MESGERLKRGGNEGAKSRSNGGRQSKGKVRFGEEEELEETRTENADELEVTGRTTEVRTGRGSAGLVRGGDERCRTDETNRKGKGKGKEGKGEHEGKGGGFGHNHQAMSDPGEGEMAEGEQQ